MSYSKKDQLIHRIESNYTDFKCSLRGVSREKLFDMAGRIYAVTDAYEMLTREYPWDEEGEIDFYLLFRDPLTIIADEWEHRINDCSADFDVAMYEVSNTDKAISIYPLLEGCSLDILYLGEPGDERIRFYGEI